MAETKEERGNIESKFWQEIAKLPKNQQQLMNAEFNRTFLQLPALVIN